MKLKKRYYILIFVILAIGIASIFIVRNKKKAEADKYVTEKVKKGDLRQIVSATGTIISPSEIDLNNLITGKLNEMKVEIGDKVKKDQILAKLEGKDLEIKVAEAQANLDAVRADLNKLLKGAKNEDIAVSVANVNKAKADYLNNLDVFENIKKQAAQDIISAEDDLKNVKDKTAKDVETYEDIVKSAETTLASSQTTLQNTKNTKTQAIVNAKETGLTSIDTKAFIADASLNVVYEIIDDSDVETAVKSKSYIEATESNYNAAVSKISLARENLAEAKNSNETDDIKTALNKINEALNETFSALLKCYDILANSITTDQLTKTELDAYKASVKTEQGYISTALTTIQTNKQTLDNAVLDYASSVDTAESNLSSSQTSLNEAKSRLELAKASRTTQILAAENSLAETKIASAKKNNDAQSNLDSLHNQWKLMERQLELKKSSPQGAEINLYRSRVSQAEALFEAAKENLEKIILRSPADGIITNKNYEIGEQTNLTAPVYSLMVINNYEIEVTIPESDIIKVKAGQLASSTLDAYSEDIEFSGKVSFIEPAETIIQDVVYYKVKIVLEESEYNVKSGMTANVDIETACRKNVLMVPQRAVIGGNGNRRVRVFENGEIKEVEIKVGLRGEDSMVEIISGLEEGREIVVFERK